MFLKHVLLVQQKILNIFGQLLSLRKKWYFKEKYMPLAIYMAVELMKWQLE